MKVLQNTCSLRTVCTQWQNTKWAAQYFFILLNTSRKLQTEELCTQFFQCFKNKHDKISNVIFLSRTPGIDTDCSTFSGCAIIQGINCQPSTSGARVWWQTTLYGLCSGKGGIGIRFPLTTSNYACECHSTHVPYSYLIHLRPTLINSTNWQSI